MDSKTLYIISGCNGAGKTTASYTILPDIWQCYEFVNADEIAKGLSPLNPESVAIEAGRLMLERIESLLKANKTFSIKRRYNAGIKNLFTIYMKCVDYWVLANNTNGDSEYVAEGGKDIDTEIFDSETYNKVMYYVRERKN